MKINAIVLPLSGNKSAMKPRLAFGAVIVAAMLAATAPGIASAQDQKSDKSEKSEKADKPQRPVTDDTVTMGDVATSPLTDLNITRDEIPPLLLDARQDPYKHEGLKKCGQIAAAIGELDLMLGDDLDIASAKGQSVSAGRVAKWAVSKFIPFRGLIREVSGAKDHERQFQDAIVAGMMRRSYLKGLGQEKGCKYPARPADEKTRERITYEQQIYASSLETAGKDKEKEKAD